MKKVILMLAVAAMASCAKSELTTRPDMPVGDVEIVSGSKVVETRTPFEGSLDDKPNNSLMAYVYATKLDASGAYVDYKKANLAAQGYMTFVSSNTQTSGKYSVDAVGFQKEDTIPGDYVTDPQYYPSNDNPLYMVGLVPAVFEDAANNKKGWGLSTDSLNAVYTIDGKTDIMAAAVTKMNDGTSAIKKSTAKIDAATPANSVYPAFDFKHKLTLVNIKAYTPTEKEQANWGKITKIELIAVNGVTNGVDQTCTVKLEDASATVSGAVTGTVTPFYSCATDGTDLVYTDLLVSTQAELDGDTGTEKTYNGPAEITVDTDRTKAAYVAYAMIAPFEAAAVLNTVNLKLKVYTEEHTNGIEVPVTYLYNVAYDYNTGATNTDYFTGRTEGKKFNVTLKFAGKEIVASATVTDWEEKFVEDVEVI